MEVMVAKFKKPSFGNNSGNDSSVTIDVSVVSSDNGDSAKSGARKQFKFKPIASETVVESEEISESKSERTFSDDGLLSEVSEVSKNKVNDTTVTSTKEPTVGERRFFKPVRGSSTTVTESTTVENVVDDSHGYVSTTVDSGVSDGNPIVAPVVSDSVIGSNVDSDSIVNPLLDDDFDEEFVIHTDRIVDSVKNPLLDDDDDFETFVGFGDRGSSVVVESVVDSSTTVDSVNDSVVDSGFGVSTTVDVGWVNPLLDDDDDDSFENVEELSSVSTVRISGSSVGGRNVSTTVDSGVSIAERDAARAVVVGAASDDSSLVSVDDRVRLDGFVAERVNSGSIVDTVSGTRSVGVSSSSDVVVSGSGDRASVPLLSREDRKKVRKGRGSLAIDSDFKRSVVSEVVVSSGGRAGSSVGAVTVSDSGRRGYAFDGKPVGSSAAGRLGVMELEFFKNLSSSKKGVLEDDSLAGLLRGSRDGLESESERKARSVLLEQAVGGVGGLRRGSQAAFTVRDREVLSFLALFRYATDAHLARMVSGSVRTSLDRLRKLRGMGLVIDRKIYGARPIWFLTEAGMLLSGYDVPRVTESKLTMSMLPHQFTVNHTASNLWSSNVNVLNLDDFPSRNRLNPVTGEFGFGEELVSELEIQSSFGKVKMFNKSDVYRPELLADIERQFLNWKRAVKSDPDLVSPEQVLGNEYMWSLMPPHVVRLAYHVPDLVVKRPRNADGSPESIAVEIEISNKPSNAYEKTLLAYKFDKTLFKKVIWVCKSSGPARKLEQIAKEIGLWQEGRIDIVPIMIDEKNIYKERDLWMI